MYTNIDKDHDLMIFERFFCSSFLCITSPSTAILAALKNIMNHNYFKFGDTIWQQQSGVAMGAPPLLLYCNVLLQHT